MLKITYAYGHGREKKINKSSSYSSDFLYGYDYLKELDYDVNYIIPTNGDNSLLIFIEKVLRKCTKLPFYMSDYISWNNIKKIFGSKVLILTNDPIALSLLPILIFYKLFKRGEIIVVIMGLLSKPKPNKLIKIFQNFIIRTLLLVSSKFIFLGKNEKLNAERLYSNKKNKLTYIPFCIDTNFWHEEKVEKIYDFIFVGNDGNRDYIFLLEMVNHLKDYKFLIISNNNQLSEYFENKIVLNADFYKGSMSESKITDAELRTMYNKSKVSLVPLSNTVQPSGQSVSLQSLSVGIPVVISNTQGNWFNGEKISSKFIYTTKQNKMESWNKILEKIHKNSNNYEENSKQMSKYIKDNLDKSVFDLNLEKIILDISGKN